MPNTLFQSPRNRVNTSNVRELGMCCEKEDHSFNPLEIGSTLQIQLH